MLDRGFSFDDPRVLALLKERFVPVAVDGHAQVRRRDGDARFFRHVVGQRQGTRLGSSRQGLYACLPDGTLLDAYNNRIVRDLVARLGEVAAAPPPAQRRPAPSAKAGHVPAAPEGTVVVKLFKRALVPPPADAPPREAHLLSAVGMDNLWLLEDEVRALRDGRVVGGLARRIARFALVDNTRGEAAPWRRGDVHGLDLRAERRGDGVRLQGAVSLADGDRALAAALLGRARWRDGGLRRFDVVARGTWLGGSPYAAPPPEDAFPFAVAATLDGAGAPVSVPPHGARRRKDYLSP